MRGVVRFRERETRALLAVQQRHQILRAERFGASGQHAGSGAERVVGESGIESRERVAHHRQGEQSRFGTADRSRLRHAEQTGFARRTDDVGAHLHFAATRVH
jgi:hypothetical protein